MDQHTHRQLQGATQLLTDTIDAAVRALGDAHLATAGRTYAVLARIPVVSVPAQAIERIQQNITGGVYRSIGAANRSAGVAALFGLDWLADRDSSDR